jgi:hypothetical protein
LFVKKQRSCQNLKISIRWVYFSLTDMALKNELSSGFYHKYSNSKETTNLILGLVNPQMQTKLAFSSAQKSMETMGPTRPLTGTRVEKFNQALAAVSGRGALLPIAWFVKTDREIPEKIRQLRTVIEDAKEHNEPNSLKYEQALTLEKQLNSLEPRRQA